MRRARSPRRRRARRAPARSAAERPAVTAAARRWRPPAAAVRGRSRSRPMNRTAGRRTRPPRCRIGSGPRRPAGAAPRTSTGSRRPIAVRGGPGARTGRARSRRSGRRPPPPAGCPSLPTRRRTRPRPTAPWRPAASGCGRAPVTARPTGAAPLRLRRPASRQRRAACRVRDGRCSRGAGPACPESAACAAHRNRHMLK